MDARLFFGLALERGFVTPALLTGEAATRATVRATLLEMAALCEPGDLFLLTFSGHGGRKRLPSREVGAWQLFDGTFNQEQLVEDLALFREGVRVLVVSDNCGGGIPERRSPQSPGGLDPSRPAIEGLLKASVLVLAACEQDRYADGPGLPAHFASTLNRVLTHFTGPYGGFHQALCHEMPSYQKPDYYRLGIPDAAFESQRPFTI